MIKRVTDDAREDEMEENLNQVIFFSAKHLTLGLFYPFAKFAC